MSKRFLCWTVLVLVSLALLGEQAWAQEQAPAGGRRNRRNQDDGQTQRGNRGANLDPAQLQERMMTRYRESLEAKEDEEWNRLKPKIEKVLAAQREGRLTGPGLARRGTNADPAAPAGDSTNRRRENRRPESETAGDPAVAALRAAVDANAPAAELKPKLAKVREKIKAREAALAAAREDLRKELSPRQEAIAAMMGLLR